MAKANKYILTRRNCSLLWCLLLLAILNTSCQHKPLPSQTTSLPATTAHSGLYLNNILHRQQLNAIVISSPHAYYLHRGQPMGYTYEMLQSFANYLEVDLNIIVSHSLSESFELLAMGKAEILAENLAITSQRKTQWLFGPSFFESQQVLVQRLPHNWQNISYLEDIESQLVRKISDLEGKTIYVPTTSVYAQRLQNIANDIGRDILKKDTALTESRLIQMVAEGNINYTACYDYIAFYNKILHKNIDIKTSIGNYRQQLTWALPLGADSLVQKMTTWLQHIRKNKTAYYIFDEYYKNTGRAQQIKQAIKHKRYHQHISPFDSLIQKHNKELDWDWRLLASLIYQESRFRNESNPVSGAFGVMQMMPETAAIYNLSDSSSIDAQIHAGIRYLHSLENEFKDRITNPQERQKFVLAAYNVGLGHVLDARRLANKYHKDSNIWYHNVEDYMMLLSVEEYYTDSVCYYGYCRGEEPYRYVREIKNRYQHYCNLLPSEDKSCK